MGPDEIRQTIDREVDLVAGAIVMVASGKSPSMTVGGLRFGEAVLKVIRAEVSTRGVVLEPLWRTDEAGCDVRVTRVVDV